MSFKQVAAALLACACAVPSWGGPASDALASCLADSTTGRDRKELARWLFVAITAHPEMRELSNATPAMHAETSQAFGRIFTRLITEDCTREARSAVKSEGSEALGKGFESLGRLAMQELTAHPDVRSAISQIDRFVDRRKVESALRPD